MPLPGDGFPRPETILTVVDTEARGALQDLKRIADDAIQSEGPKRTHHLVDGFQERVTKTKTGHQLVIAPQRNKRHPSGATIAEIVRWTTRGTGLYREGAGGKRRIRSSRHGRRMVLPGGRKVWSVKGQRPNDFVTRAKDRVDHQAPLVVDRHADEISNRLGRLR
jgi:hypothetical protein